MTINRANLSRRCSIWRSKSVVFTLSCERNCQSAQKCADGHLQVTLYTQQRCRRWEAFCYPLSCKQDFSQFFAHISVFVVFKYPYKLSLHWPTCTACRELTAQTFLTLHLFGRNFPHFWPQHSESGKQTGQWRVSRKQIWLILHNSWFDTF